MCHAASVERRIAAVVFDLGGVLTPPVFGPLDELNDSLGLPEGTLRSFFRGDEVFAQVERGEVSFRDFLKSVGTRVQAAHGLRLDLRALAAAVEAPGHLEPAMVDLVRRLHGDGLRLGLLTNNAKESVVWRETLPRECFDVVVDSSEVGLRKPDPRIYALALERLGLPADQVLYVDDFAENLPPAADLGMRTWSFDGRDRLDAFLRGVVTP
ncbi:HAD-IA family hydrolase [Sporichthya brevicatena]|uniref:HAD-IA family hydrolase n=1 Tax=Sporichthya brevicatena TaxID=171442 RepID=A0ABN1GQE2_9ACTN